MTNPPKQVLIIDDEKGVVKLCQRLLERQGYRVYSALSPETGLKILDQHPMDLLLLDIRMPGLDGFRVMQLARQVQPDLVVLMITGHGTIELAMEALQEGADGLALKPFTASELIKSIEQALVQNQRKREMSRLVTIKPLIEFSEQLYRELTPTRLRRLANESICKYLCCNAALFLKVSVSHKLAPNKLVPVIQKQLYFAELLPDFHKDREIASALADLVVRSLLNQRTESMTRPIENNIQNLLVTPVVLNIPGVTPDDSNFSPQLRTMRREHDSKSWLILGAIRVADDRCIRIELNPSSQVFSTSEADLLTILSHQTATAFENALLNSELRANIRKLKSSQQLLLQAERMAASGRLMASIAHEINNPLQAVQNCIHLAGRQDLQPENRQDYLEMAQSELERLTKTVQRMLDFFRPSNNDRQQIDINLAIQRVSNLMRQRLDISKINLSLALEPNLPKVYAVSDQLQQVLLNLMINSIEAMPEGGTLQISTRFSSKKWIDIITQDSGPGVDPKIRKHVFEPFSSAKVGGTGLGLSISHEIVASHGGSLELIHQDPLVEEPDSPVTLLKGACFRIRLPVG